MQEPSLKYGRRLTDEEYEKAIVAIQNELPSTTTKDQESTVRRSELNLAIDHRLGVNFPADRREALWAIQERLEKRRMFLALLRLFPRRLEQASSHLADYLVREYSTVLTPSEVREFFDLDDVSEGR